MSNFEAMAEKTIKNIIFITPDRNDTKGAIVLGNHRLFKKTPFGRPYPVSNRYRQS